MNRFPILILSFLCLFATWQTTAAQEQDIETLKRKRGTTSAEAALLFEEAHQLYRKEEYKKSIDSLKQAMEADPEFQLGLYWLALASEKIGDSDSEYDYYEQLYQTRTTEISSIVVDGCVNAGIGKAQKEEPAEAEKWFGRALLLDPDNKYNLAWKIYRNMAISKINDKQSLSAAICAAIGHDYDQEQIPKGMVDQFSRQAAGDVGTIASFETAPNEFNYLDQLPTLGTAQGIPEVTTPLEQILDLPDHHCILAIPKDGKFVDLIDYSNAMRTKRFNLQGRPQAAVVVDGKTFLSVTSPNRLIEWDPKTGKEVKRWNLNQSAPKSFSVAPKHNLAFLVQGDGLRILNLVTGKESLSPYSVTGIACDPNQEFVYGFYRPIRQSSTDRGEFLIDGRPIYFEIESRDDDWTQSTLFRFKIATGKSEGTLLLSQIRMNAASNAKQISVSPDGTILGIVGGGGWRPTVDHSQGGYGILFMDANDLNRVLRFVETDAYPQTAAISRADHLILAQGGKTVLTQAVNDDAFDLAFEGEQVPYAFVFSGDGKWLFQAYEDHLDAVPLNRPAQP